MKSLRLTIVIVIIAVTGVAQDLLVNLDACNYDACRFLKYSYVDYLVFSPETPFSPTALQHLIYGTATWGEMPFIRSALINIAFLIACHSFADNTAQRQITESPLAISMLCLPGKEVFLILAILTTPFESFHKNGISPATLTRAILPLLLLIAARPAYIPIFFLCIVLSDNLQRRNHVGALKISILLVAATSILFTSDTFGISEVEDFAEESSTKGVDAARNATSGFTPLAILIRAFIYAAYIAVLPAFEIFRIVSEIVSQSLMPYHLFLAGAAGEWSRQLAKRGSTASTLVIAPSIIVAATFPFVHTRYLLPCIVAIIVYKASRPITPMNRRKLRDCHQSNHNP